MSKIIKILFCASLLITCCCKRDPREETSLTTESNSKENIPKQTPIKIIVTDFKPTYKIYVENSGSMNGYVEGVTEFEQSVYNYLTDIKISGLTDSLKMFYINSEIIALDSDIKDFIDKLEPSTFKAKGGSMGTSDISNILKSVLNETKEKEVSILVTDGIFSPGKNIDADQYLVNQKIGIKSSIADYLKEYPTTAIIVYQSSSSFEGTYYNREDKPQKINKQRPFYIWIIGNSKNINSLIDKVPAQKFQGNGIQNIFTIVKGNKTVNYAIKNRSGNFKLDKKNSKNSLIGLSKNNRDNLYQFSVDVDFSNLLLDDKYLTNSKNYELYNKSINLSIQKASNNSFGYTHTLKFTSDRVISKGTLNVKLKMQIPDWVEEVNDDDGITEVNEKTYGIKYQIEGVYEAFTFNNDFYTKITINIK